MTNDYKNPFDFFDYQKFLSAVKLPAAGNNEQAVTSSKKTLEAYAGASKAIYEGFNGFAKKQVEILNSAIAKAKDATSELSSGQPQDNVAKSIELTKKSIEDAQANVSELAKIYEKTTNEAFEILNARFLEGLGELKGVVVDASDKASAPAGSAKK
ncbi:MAG: TIGR01841 family phasin [Pelagibacteraceae bacterium]|nr:TIGR01841 family phasin [Pelagibacteraceae bacterium]